jgi:dethiobiotin synthetase
MRIITPTLFPGRPTRFEVNSVVNSEPRFIVEPVGSLRMPRTEQETLNDLISKWVPLALEYYEAPA